MSDKKLLKLAAKAAGIEVIWVDKHDCGLMDVCMVPLPKAVQHFVLKEYPHNKWRPREDDGDALRLAAKLGINIIFYGGFHYVGVERFPVDICQVGGMDEIRYKILCAAAAIGESMQPGEKNG